jgi:hypothetical protein
MVRERDWKSLCYEVDGEMDKPQWTYKFLNGRKFLNDKQRTGYQPYAVGVGSWAVGIDNVVAPTGYDQGTSELADWLKDTWPDIVISGGS